MACSFRATACQVVYAPCSAVHIACNSLHTRRMQSIAIELSGENFARDAYTAVNRRALDFVASTMEATRFIALRD